MAKGLAGLKERMENNLGYMIGFPFHFLHQPDVVAKKYYHVGLKFSKSQNECLLSVKTRLCYIKANEVN